MVAEVAARPGKLDGNREIPRLASRGTPCVLAPVVILTVVSVPTGRCSGSGDLVILTVVTGCGHRAGSRNSPAAVGHGSAIPVFNDDGPHPRSRAS